jgi:thioredoxin reductase
VDGEQVVVVGAGVAGTSAAIEAARLGQSVTLVDEHPLDLASMAMDTPYFFGPRLLPTLADRGLMMERIVDSDERLPEAEEAGVKVLLGTCAWGSFRPEENSRHLERPCVGLADGERSWMLDYEQLILAPGARDFVLSFPGWELSGVLGARAAMSLMTRYRALIGRRIVILGSGNLGLKTALQALEYGLDVAGIVDVSPEVRGHADLWARLARRGVPFFGSHTVQEVQGEKEVRAIRLVGVDAAMQPVAGTAQTVPCDTVCLALGLVPNVELAYLTGCGLGYRPELGGWVPDRSGAMETSVAGVYVVGDGGGVHEEMVATPGLARDQGHVAAAAVAEARSRSDQHGAQGLEPEISAVRGSAGSTGRSHDEDPRGQDSWQASWLRSLVAAGGMDVVVCQCEGVTRQDLVEVRPPRYLAGSPPRRWDPKLPTILEAGSAHPDLVKRLTRAGMGHCQGRRCREQVALLLADASGVDVSQVPLASYRPPVRPVPMRILSSQDEPEATREKWAAWFSPWTRLPS